jgi:hypothetical protein
MADVNKRFDWNDEDTYWRSNFRSRPYASGGHDYDFFQPGYRYGYEAANKYHDRSWNDVESDLSKSWNSYQYKGNSTWEQMKDAVRDAWDRVTGNRPVGAHR